VKRSIGIAAPVIMACACTSVVLAFGDGRGGGPGARGVAPANHLAMTKGEAGPDGAVEAMMRFEAKIRWRGTEVVPHPKVSREMEKLHRRIGELFAAQDPAPSPARLAHFRAFHRPDTRIVGWYGSVEDVAGDSDQLLVKVRMAPHLVMEGATIASTTDSCVEVYAVRAGLLQLLRVEEREPGRINFLFTD
jgi:hypothetical protein